MSISKVLFHSSLVAYSVLAQAEQSMHIGGISIHNSGGITIVNGKVVSSSIGTIQGSGVTQTTTRELAAFNAVESHLAAIVNIRKGSGHSCTIVGDANILPIITTPEDQTILKVLEDIADRITGNSWKLKTAGQQDAFT